MKKIVINSLDDYNLFLKNIRKYKKDMINKYKIEINMRMDCFIKMQIKSIEKVLNTKDKEKRIKKVYDEAYNYLDKLCKTNNYCGFCGNKCLNNSNKLYKKNNSCCGNCIYLTDNGCSIKSLTCKLFFCKYLTKTKVVPKYDDILVLKYFLNLKQKQIIKNSFFQDEEKVLLNIQKRLLPW